MALLGLPRLCLTPAEMKALYKTALPHFRPSGSQAGGLSLNPERSPPPPGTHRWDKLAPRALDRAGVGVGASAWAWKEEGRRSARCPTPTHALSPGT